MIGFTEIRTGTLAQFKITFRDIEMTFIGEAAGLPTMPLKS
jgi:hypothetical protein